MQAVRAALTLALAVTALAVPAANADPGPLGTYGVGSPGGTAGQLDSPRGVAVDGAGTVHVADTSNDRVATFNSQGAFVRAFGFDVDPGGGAGFEVCTTSCKSGVSGAAAGQLALPHGIATDATGSIYVAEAGTDRISVFTPEGAFLRAFGFDVVPGAPAEPEVCTTSCQAGVAGAAAGQLNDPGGIALDPAGDVYVAENDNHRISVFTAQGAFLRAFGFDVVPGGPAEPEVCTSSCQAGVFGAAAGQFNNPEGLGVDAAGNVYVADLLNNRISVSAASGAFQRAFGFDVIPGGPAGLEVCTTTCQAGVSGGGAGQLAFPAHVAIDAAGNPLVADFSNNRISMFTPEGAFQRAFGFDVIPGGAAAFEVCTTSCQAGLSGGGTGQLFQPQGVATDCRGSIYVADRDNHRIQRFGEPGTAVPPCTDPPPPAVKPSNEFTIGKAKRKPKNGTAKLSVTVPGPGVLELAGEKAKATEKTAPAAGALKLLVKAKGKAKVKLHEDGKVKLKLAITFTPTGGDPNTKSKRVKLKREGS